MDSRIKPRIVHLVNELGLDGSSKVVLQLCKCFRSTFEISVVSISNKDQLSHTSEWPKNVPVRTFDFYFDPDYSLRRYLSLYFFGETIRSRSADIVACLESLSPDIIHCHLQPRELLILRSFSNRKTPLLFTDHLVRIKSGQYAALNEKILAWVYRGIYKRFHIAAVAKPVMECHSKFHLINKKREYALIQNRVDTEKYAPRSNKSGPLRIIYVARMDQRKGHDVLLTAWKKIETEKLRLILIGDGERASYLHSLSEMLVLNYVSFAGSQENVLPFLQDASIGVFPSLHEGLPLALLEKMACGLAVVVSDIPELTAIVHDRVNGLVFKAGDPDDLASKMQVLIDDESLRTELGNNARKYIVDNFDVSVSCKEYEKMYHRLLKTPAP